MNDADGAVDSFQKPNAQWWNPLVVELCRLNEVRFSLGAMNQAHPMARRATPITSS